MKLTADREVCVGAGMCALTAPGVFDQDEEEGLVTQLIAEPVGADAEAAEEAIRACPSGALRMQ
ncbi:(4Fe-4S)-binding protein [Streptomyces sp. NPDC048057]|uniref:ferredoxin n=1 Tax=Streptomyces sp. NPDC048057 TaxID=3155628 RepID=UPI0034067FF2